MRPLCLFYKVLLNKVSKYIHDLIPPFKHSLRNSNSFTSFTCRSEYFKNSFFLCFINYWNKLHPKICNSASYLSFKNAPINFIRPLENKTFNIHDEVDIIALTRLRLGLRHLREHTFRHNFVDTSNLYVLAASSLKQQCIFFCAAISIILLGQTL